MKLKPVSKSVESLLDHHGMANGVGGAAGTVAWWAKEDDRPLVKMIVQGIADLEQCEADLVKLTASIIDSAATVRADVENGYHINGHGLLIHPTGLELMAQRRKLLIEHLNQMLWVLKKGF